MKLPAFVSVGLCLWLPACSSLETLKRDQVFRDLENGKDTCGLKYTNPFIETDFDSLSVRAHLPEKYQYRVFDPRPYLAGGLDQISITNLVPQRQNIELDKDGKIKNLRCG